MKLTRALLSWMRQVLPRDTIVATAAGCAIVVELAYLWCHIRWGNPDEAFFSGARLFVQVLSIISYGTHRVATFHPANDNDYRLWLEASPWTPRMPLPMGPVHLVPQDLLIVAASMALTRRYDWTVLYVPIAFLSAYVFMMAVTVRLTGQRVWAYLLGLALGGIAVSGKHPAEALMTAGAAAALSLVALQSSLRSFPWNLPWFAQVRDWTKALEERKERRTGWPFDVLAPPENPGARLIEFGDGIGISLLAGWWYFAVLWHLSDEAGLASAALLSQVAMWSTLARLGIYMKNHRPPISFLGRFCTLRPWQSGYDEIILGPLAAIGLGIFLPGSVVLTQMAVRGPMNVPRWMLLSLAPAGLTIYIAILLMSGPHLTRWRLAGRHRIVFDQAGQQTGLGQSTANKDFVQTG